MRVNALKEEDYALMGRAGFRFLLVGMESANQKTLDRLDKGIKAEEVAKACRMAKKAGLEPHLTIMMGYPWETREDAQKTVDYAKKIFRNGWADTLQATIMIPYPGTPLFEECRENGWLMTEDWDMYDMRSKVMKSEISDEDIKEFTRQLYKIFLTPDYVFRRLVSIRSVEDMKFIKRGVRSVIGHLTDFSNRKARGCENENR
jgi:radical SAM superfamily enzyme YgiQ (UPF0313 family)